MRWSMLWTIAVVVAPGVAVGEEPVRHRFLAVDNSKNLLLCVDQQHPERSWTTPIPAQSRDLQLLPVDASKPPAAVLVSHGNGAREYILANGKPMSWAVERYSGIQSAVRRSDGKTLLCGIDGTIYQLDAHGAELARHKPDREMSVRLMRAMANGNLLISGAKPAEAFEVDLAGHVVRSISLPPGAKGYKTEALPNGNFLTSTGDLCKIAEIDAKGRVVAYVGGKEEHPTLGLDFCSGWQLLPNGNRVMANWLGHGKQGRGVHLAEFTPANKLVWQWADHALAKQITNVLVIE